MSPEKAQELRDQTLRQFDWDLPQVPEAKSKAAWNGHIGEIRLTDNLGDPDATKSTSKKVGQDKRYTGQGRWKGKNKDSLGQTPGQPSQPVADPSSAALSGQKVHESLKRQLEDASDTNGKKQKPLAPTVFWGKQLASTKARTAIDRLLLILLDD
ncbi:hypothetical protein MCOR25_011109 [Pyricularia grisea]|nr:hypothetical protein MCOR25_011109 [Pyricularia grisea]